MGNDSGVTSESVVMRTLVADLSLVPRKNAHWEKSLLKLIPLKIYAMV